MLVTDGPTSRERSSPEHPKPPTKPEGQRGALRPQGSESVGCVATIDLQPSLDARLTRWQAGSLSLDSALGLQPVRLSENMSSDGIPPQRRGSGEEDPLVKQDLWKRRAQGRSERVSGAVHFKIGTFEEDELAKNDLVAIFEEENRKLA